MYVLKFKQLLDWLVRSRHALTDEKGGLVGTGGGERFKKGFVLAKEKRRGVIWRVKRRERGRGQVN